MKGIIGPIVLFLFSTGCYPEDDTAERRNCTLDGVYNCQIAIPVANTTPPSWQIISMTKIASLPPQGYNNNIIYIDLGDLGSQGYRMGVVLNPVTNKLTITPAPGAAGTPYTQMDSPLPAVPPLGLFFPAFAANTYDPGSCTLYIRVGFVGGTGWRVYEEVMVHQ